MKLNVLTDADITVLKALIKAQKDGIANKGPSVPGQGDFGDDQNTPEVYIALPPEGGIPALVMNGSSPTDGATPGYAECVIYRIVHNLPDDPTLEELGIPDQVVYNLSTSIIGDDTAWVVIKRDKLGTWLIESTAPADIQHCRVTECRGSGYYKGTIGARPPFVIPSAVSTTGTAPVANSTGTGTSDSSDCDPCSNVIGGTVEGDTEASCGSLQAPSRIIPGSTESTVWLYDARAIPIKTPGHAIIVDMGDTVEDPDAVASTGTGTGTGTATSRVKIYMVLSATYEVVGIPDRFYECCDGPPQQVIMTRCDTYIVEGAFCPGVQISCPAGTGTAS